MSENQDGTRTVDLDTAFLRSRRGILKVAELVTLFVAFVCFTASVTQYFVATIFEFLITLFLLLLHLFKLDKKLRFFFWPLVDVFNSTFAAVYLLVVSLIVLTTYYNVTGTLIGGVLCLISAALYVVESYTLFKNITLNKRRNDNQNQATG